MIQNMKEMLETITEEYNGYQEEKEKKIGSLMKELKWKDQCVEELEIKLGQSRNELNLYKG